MDKNFTSGASSVTVQYSVTGNCQNKVSFEEDSDFISTNQTSTSITISVSENIGEARSGHVYTLYNNTRCNNNTITIRQAAGPCIPTGVSYQYYNYSGSVEACDTSKTVTVSGVKTTTYRDESCEQKTEDVTSEVTLNFDKNTSSDGRTIQSSFTINNSEVTVALTQPGGCDESEDTYENQYLTIESKSNDNTISFKTFSTGLEKTISVSTDGERWTTYTSSHDGKPIATLNESQKVFLRGENTSYDGVVFMSSGKYELYGNIMSLIYGESYKGKKELTNEYAFRNLFSGSTNLISAERLSLPAETLTYGCYFGMFRACNRLETAPKLPAMKLAGGCYNFMFGECHKLVKAPELPATTLGNDCYANMFYTCSGMTTAPSVLPATTLMSGCYQRMFYYCKGLKKAPKLPATTLTGTCYNYMFEDCSNLNSITCLATNVSSDAYTIYWLKGVAATGTFTKAAGTNWRRNANGIPSDWNVLDAQ